MDRGARGRAIKINSAEVRWGEGACNQQGGRITARRAASYQIDQGKIICAGERPRLCAINAVYEQ